MTISAKIKVYPEKKIGVINPNLYGHFCEHLGRLVYDGIWVGSDSKISNIDGLRKDIIDALKEINPPVARWPGGCFADDYHWQDGIGPRNERPNTVNIHWNALESNEFGTHEFLRFCKLIGAEPYIAANVGSGTVKEMRDWIEYLNCSQDTTLSKLRAKNGHEEPFNVKYFGIGNENWGCGGNMSPKYYADVYKRYATYAKSFAEHELYKIAAGPSSFNLHWTYHFFKRLCENKFIGCPYRLPLIDAFAMHYYTGSSKTATDYTEKEWYSLLRKCRKIEILMKAHRWIMNRYDRGHNVDLIVDEWGTWHKEEEGTTERWLYQQNTIRDALVAAMTLDIFNNNCEIVKMANIAQTVNVLQALILTNDDDMLLTPTYHVFNLYKNHQGADALRTKIKTKGKSRVPLISGSCSSNKDKIMLSLVNAHASKPIKARIVWCGRTKPGFVEGSMLKADDIHDHNTFEQPDKLKLESFSIEGDGVTIPPRSVVTLSFSRTIT